MSPRMGGYVPTDHASRHQDGGRDELDLTGLSGAISDHGELGGLTDDDHTQYLKEKASGGTAAETPAHTHQAAATCGQLDHGAALTGLTDDDHTQYMKGSTGGRTITIVHKTADQTVTNSATLADDDELKFAVGANEVWELTLGLRLNAHSTPDLKFAFTVPSGATIIYTEIYRISPDDENDATTAVTVAGSNNDARVLLSLLYTGGASAGDVQLQWAQNVSDANETKVLTNSFIIAHRLVQRSKLNTPETHQNEHLGALNVI